MRFYPRDANHFIEPRGSAVWSYLTDPRHSDDLIAAAEFYNFYCKDSDDVSVLSCTEIDNTILAVNHHNDFPLDDPHSYTIVQYDAETHTEKMWLVKHSWVWQGDDYTFESVRGQLHCTLQVENEKEIAHIYLSQSGMTWTQEGTTIQPHHCYSPTEIAYVLAKRIKA